MDRHWQWIQALRRTVFEQRGDVEPAVREAVGKNQGVPEELRVYIDKIHNHAYKVTDEDVAALKKAGYTDDQLFELTVSASVGAGLERLEAGLAPLRKAT